VKEPMSEDQTEPMTTFIDVDELNSLSQLWENSEQNTVTDSENVTLSLGRNADRVAFLLNFNLSLLILAFYRSHKISTYFSFYTDNRNFPRFLRTCSSQESELRN
jgi:hypothetical protein